MAKRKLYPTEVAVTVDEQLPEKVLEAMDRTGWNALGIYELVKKELAAFKRKQKKEKNDGV